ncbi:MAG: NifU family protein [Verrucomicrobia bacterium]|nr:NifU family protein [Verrucomicrobiota bacterium]MBV8484862.1 NifU family protein [Verrucomicrobiota bacterium]
MEHKSAGPNGESVSASPAANPGDDINAHGERLQKLLGEVEALPYPGAKELIQDCMESVLGFYGAGLKRILQVVSEDGPEGRKVFRDLIRDDVVKGLLLIHDLHPLNLEARLLEALDKVRPYLNSHGGNVELISLENDVARLRLQGTCQSCASSSVTLELAIRHAIEQACPDLVHFDVEGVAQNQLAVSQISRRTITDWTVVKSADQLEEGARMPVRIGDVRLVVCKVNDTLYAYRNRCPACNMPLDTGSFEGGFLSCALNHRYDVVHAGRCAEIPSAHLDPLPLLVQENVVKVALTKEVLDAPSETVQQNI